MTMHRDDIFRIYLDHVIKGRSEQEAVELLVDLLGGLIASGFKYKIDGVEHFERNLPAAREKGAGITTLSNDILSLTQKLIGLKTV